MSVILPVWPARFQDSDFREFVESLFREQAPAHMRLQFFWMTTKEMKKFESVYFSWITSLKEGRGENKYQSLSKELVGLLSESNTILV